MGKKILSVFLIGILSFGLVGCGSDTGDNSADNSNNTTTNEGTDGSTNETKNKKYGLGDTFTFDGMELTFDTTYSFVTVDNEYSEYNGQSVIKLGVNVKNVSSETSSLNMFYYTLFGSQGTELESVTAYFDDSVDFGGDLRPDASYKKYFYILYDGNGTYGIDFDNYSEQMSVEFNVTK